MIAAGMLQQGRGFICPGFPRFNNHSFPPGICLQSWRYLWTALTCLFWSIIRDKLKFMERPRSTNWLSLFTWGVSSSGHYVHSVAIDPYFFLRNTNILGKHFICFLGHPSGWKALCSVLKSGLGSAGDPMQHQGWKVTWPWYYLSHLLWCCLFFISIILFSMYLLISLKKMGCWKINK